MGVVDGGRIQMPFVNTSTKTLSDYSRGAIAAELPCYVHKFVFRWKPYVPPLLSARASWVPTPLLSRQRLQRRSPAPGLHKFTAGEVKKSDIYSTSQ